MTNPASPSTAEVPLVSPLRADTKRPSPGHRRRRWITGVVVMMLVAAGVVVGVANPFAKNNATSPGVTDNAYPTSLATVTRQDLTSQTTVDATLGYARNYSAVRDGFMVGRGLVEVPRARR